MAAGAEHEHRRYNPDKLSTVMCIYIPRAVNNQLLPHYGPVS